jgi:DNA ligase D
MTTIITPLEEYNRKRDFDITSEPEGAVKESGASLSFAVQHHMARREHYDLRLEWNGVLLSWAVPKVPSYDTREKRLAVKVEDHPLEYRDFEGTIPQGEYGGGTVMLWDEGFWEPFGDADEGLAKGALKFLLYGRRLKGKWALVKLKDKDSWLLIKEKDDYSITPPDLSEHTESVKTGRTMFEIQNGADDKTVKNPFERADVQLAKLSQTIPEGDDWMYELKYDGYRIVAYIESGGVRLITRGGNDYTMRFSGVATALADWADGRAMVLDGEMAVTDTAGKTDFGALQNYIKKPQGQNLVYIIFDLLALDGKDLRGNTLTERKAILETLLTDAPKKLCYSRHVIGGGRESFNAACELGMEGIVGKKAESVYSGTRSGDWIKIKCGKRQEFVIGGFTRSDKKPDGISSLLLGVYEGEALIFTGRVGTGFNKSNTKELLEKFKAINNPESLFSIKPKIGANETVIWLKPLLVAEIKFAEWTKDNLLRQASYKGLRTDKEPKTVYREEAVNISEDENEAENGAEKLEATEEKSITIQGVKITHPEKILFDNPQITKEEVVRYYERIADRMLPFVAHRILSIVRCPKGVSQTCFYKKHPGAGSRGIVTIQIANSDGEKYNEEYFYIEDATGLVSEAQMGTLEFHTWGSRVETLEQPDIMVFDLDPDEGMLLDRVRQGVRDLKGILDELSLVSYLKTSGGKGYHVAVPFAPSASWDAFRDFAKRVAEVMEQKWPDRYTSNIRKAKRSDKIFIDWIRNSRGSTSVAPYSIRARAGAKVSMPIRWDELDAVAPDSVGIYDALERLNNTNPWSDFYRTGQVLKL